MGIKTIAKAASSDVTDNDLLSGAVKVASLPFTAFTDDGSYISSQAAGIGMLVTGVTTLFVGEAWGHKREREGKQSFVPLMRG